MALVTPQIVFDVPHKPHRQDAVEDYFLPTVIKSRTSIIPNDFANTAILWSQLWTGTWGLWLTLERMNKDESSGS